MSAPMAVPETTHNAKAAKSFIAGLLENAQVTIPHSARAPESFTTFAHFGISRAM